MRLKLLFGTFVGAAIVSMLTPLAHAITITDATLSSGNVTVSGNRAAKFSPIAWEGTQVATSTRRGTFTFTTAVVPADCIGTVTDGISTVDVAIAGCTPPPAALTATGQTTCWNSSGNVIPCAGTGQDGDIKAGAALSYTDNGDGTITDNNTGLVWEKKSNDGSIHNSDTTYSWAAAFTYFIDVLNDVPNGGQSCFAGHCDWRLPNIKELQSIVNYEKFNPSVSAEFNDCANGSCTHSGSYWSSSSYVYDSTYAWNISFTDGTVNGNFKGTENYLVRAVRGGL